MKHSGYKSNKHCRWCGMTYKACKPDYADGFCSVAHRQAHYRAYKSYVTHAAWQPAARVISRVTQKKR